MKASQLKRGDVLVIGHAASDTMTVLTVKALDIEWDGDEVAPKPGSAFEISGTLENGRARTIALQSDDEVEVQ